MTLNLPKGVYQMARFLAKFKTISFGDAIAGIGAAWAISSTPYSRRRRLSVFYGVAGGLPYYVGTDLGRGRQALKPFLGSERQALELVIGE